MPSLGKMWAKKGERPVAAVRIGYENFFVYSAVNPDTGEDVTLFLREVNTKTMNHFLAHMSAALGERRCLLVMDRAEWHCSNANLRSTDVERYTPKFLKNWETQLFQKYLGIRFASDTKDALLIIAEVPSSRSFSYQHAIV